MPSSKAPSTGKILIICHGNINRSPACACILWENFVDVASAGFVNPGRRAALKMRNAVAAFGYDLSEHRSKLVTKAMVDYADLIIYMDNGNRKRLVEQFGEDIMTKAKCLGEFARPAVTRIPDPAFMAKGNKMFTDTVSLIIMASEQLVEYIKQHYEHTISDS